MVTALGLLGALVVLFAAAALATREGPVLQPVAPDRPDAGLPTGGLGPQDLHRVRFSMAVRGYRMDEVDAVLDRAAEALAAEQERVRALQRLVGGHEPA